MSTFALIGAAGYVAPKHLKAIKDVGGTLVAAHDISDSVGILDSYFKDAEFTTNYNEFGQLCQQSDIDYLVVCTPNHEHVKHCLLGLMTARADVICEKPVSLHSVDVTILEGAEQMAKRKIYPILQMRYALVPPPLIEEEGHEEVLINYVSPRGNWYHNSWKGKKWLSGGLVTNIGIHLFDWLLHNYGECMSHVVGELTEERFKGTFYFEKAKVSVFLSIEPSLRKQRIINIEGARFDLTKTFNNLHTKSYWEIMEGRGFGLKDCKESIELCEGLR